MTTEREGFCLGCGDVNTINPDSIYRANGDLRYGARGDGPLPGWCRKPVCIEARKRFDAVVNSLLYDARTIQ